MDTNTLKAVTAAFDMTYEHPGDRSWAVEFAAQLGEQGYAIVPAPVMPDGAHTLTVSATDEAETYRITLPPESSVGVGERSAVIDGTAARLLAFVIDEAFPA